MVKKSATLNFKNPVIAAQVLESPFVPDSYLGHTMPTSKDFIGEKDFIDLEQLIQDLKISKKKVILNIGDSSTSGWDSNIVTQNRDRLSKTLPLLPAFFQYKTYSDYLRDLIGDEYLVINAGVPAHTSLQGSRRLGLLLDRFKQEKIDIHWVTAYYGNNDSVWDHNRQDKEWIEKSKKFFLNRFFKEENISPIITRVSANDYRVNMEQIILTCRNQKISLIIIEPITPIYWKPGTRVLNEDLERKEYPGSNTVYQLLDEARLLWNTALKEKSYSELKKIILEEAREKDYIVPRIKKGHLAALHNLVDEYDLPFIQISLDRTQDDIRYFIDYCHPINDTNKFIANQIHSIISGKISQRTRLKQLIEKAHTPMSNKKEELMIPIEHYTLF
ncbi:MAG: hypothetical protein L0207_04135 [Chlamydiae bacterium]|nr:hypothetical protein [Chlamydiota bacterium]